MATRSIIAIKLDNDLYKTIYCHHDGYLTHNGALLLDHYNTREKIEELLRFGDLSILAKNINPNPSKEHSFEFEKRQDDVCVFYGRDRGESGTEAKTLSLKEMFKESWIDYYYIFTFENEWKFYDYNKRELKDIKEELDKEYEKIGIKRPKNFYGFWTPSSLAKEKQKQNSSEGEL